MKKKLFTLCVLGMLFQSLQAYVIDNVATQQMAMEFIGTLDGVSSYNVSVDDVATISSSIDVTIPILRIYNTHSLMGKARFVIVSADNRARSILAYGDSTIDLEHIPDAMQELIDIYRQQIESLGAGNSGGFYSLIAGADFTANASSVDPLLKTKWGQGKPFNNHCPEYPEGSDTHCLTGCTSTALSMIFKYHQHANLTADIDSYKTSTLSLTLDSLPPIQFDWQNMDTVYQEGVYTTEQAEAVSWLMRYVGQTSKMDYTTGESGANIPNVRKTISTFGYTHQWLPYDSSEYNPQMWEDLILSELQAARPVMYFARKENGGGHAFVIDGYDAVMNHYHVNWGWTGGYNGYFALNALKPFANASAYNTGQSVIINIKPADTCITVDKDNVTLRSYVSQLTRETITVSGLNFSQDITLEIKNDTAQCFEVHPLVIHPKEANEAVGGKVINIYFRPSQVGWSSATLVLSSDEIVPVEIELKGYGIRHDGDIVLDSTSLNIVDTVIIDSSQSSGSQFQSGKIRRLDMYWQGAEDQTPIMINMPDPLIEPSELESEVENQERSSSSFNVEIEGDSCYQVSIIPRYFGEDIDPVATNHVYYTLCVFYTFLSPPGPHEAIVKITHNSLSVPPAYLRLHGTGVWDENASYLYGDVNGDNVVDVSDVTALISYVLDGDNVSIIELAADMNGDGDVDVSDVTMLIQYVLGGTPSFSTSVTALDFGTVEAGDEHSETFTVSGNNLAGNLTLSSSSPFYTVTPTTITAAEVAAGATVTVTYNPIEEGAHDATLTISGGGATGRSVSLFGECIPKPTITATPSTWNFGTVDLGNQVSKTFTITGTNLGDDITFGTPMETNSGEYTISPTWLPASGGTLTITYKPLDTGYSSAQFSFTSGQAIAHITVEGNCVTTPTISTSTPSLNFGSIASGDEKARRFTVTGAYLTGDLTLTAHNSYYTVTPSTITAEEAAVGKIVTVTFNPAINAVPGAYNSTITISGGGAENMTVSLMGECVNPLILTDVTSLKFTKSGSKQFTVSGSNWPDNLTLTITGSGSQYFSLSRTTINKTEADNGATITVFCNPPSDLLDANAQIVISGGGTSRQTVDLSYHRPNIDQCPISISTTYLNFDNVILGDTKTDTFTVTIESPIPWEVDSLSNLTLSSSNPCFTVSPTTISLAEAIIGQTVTVTYTPTAVGQDVATITISGDNVESDTITLSGECVSPLILTDVTSLEFTESGSKQFTVSGSNWPDNLTLTITGSGSQYFSLSRTTINKTEADNGATVTVFCNVPSDLLNANAQIVISGGGSFTKTIDLSYINNSPIISTSDSSIHFATVSFGEDVYESRQFIVQGFNLIGDVTLNIMDSKNQYFTLDKSMIEMEDALNGATVTVTCNVPGNLQSARNYIVINTIGATKIIDLFYSSGK